MFSLSKNTDTYYKKNMGAARVPRMRGSITAAHSFRILYFGSKISSTNKPIHIYNSFKFIADIVFFIRNNFSIYSSNKKLFRNKNNFFATKKIIPPYAIL